MGKGKWGEVEEHGPGEIMKIGRVLDNKVQRCEKHELKMSKTLCRVYKIDWYTLLVLSIWKMIFISIIWQLYPSIIRATCWAGDLQNPTIG